MKACVEPLELALPLDRYIDAFPRQMGTFLLDGAGPRTRASMLGAAPFLTFRAWRQTGSNNARIVVKGAGRHDELVGDPFAMLRELLARYAPSFPSRPLPFMAGAVGYFGYEVGQWLERLPKLPRPGDGMPDVAFGFHRWVLGTTDQGAFLSIASEDPDATRAEIIAVLRAFESRAEPLPHPTAPVPQLEDFDSLARSLGVRRSVSHEQYVQKVHDVKKHLDAGDAYEVCLTHALDAPFAGDPARLFRALRHASPAPYAALLDLPEGAVVSSSPECFVSLDARGAVESRPIKGTRPRGASEAEDVALASDLAENEKDRAENAMIVDLVRNDLGRVCRWGSVEVPAFGVVEPYASVHQLVSTVRGELAPGCDALDVIRACFPPGSMTGAPKIEAMRILEGLEPLERGVYSGALGFLDFDGTMDFSVVIRTVVAKGERATFHVGGAVVADSDAESEHTETLHKARAILGALASMR